MSKPPETDWTAAARLWAPEIPEEQVKRIAPVLDALEQTVRPVLSGLPFDLAPATDVEPGA